MNIHARFGLWMLIPLLTGCGLVQLPEQSAQDFYATNGSFAVTPAQVSYGSDNQLQVVNVPGLPYSRATVDATITYRGQSKVVRFEVFASAKRPDCPVIASGLDNFSPALVCEGPATGQVVGEIALIPNVVTPLHLEGAVLAQGLRAKTLYIGLRVLEGKAGINEYLEIRQIKLRAWL